MRMAAVRRSTAPQDRAASSQFTFHPHLPPTFHACNGPFRLLTGSRSSNRVTTDRGRRPRSESVAMSGSDPTGVDGDSPGVRDCPFVDLPSGLTPIKDLGGE